MDRTKSLAGAIRTSSTPVSSHGLFSLVRSPLPCSRASCSCPSRIFDTPIIFDTQWNCSNDCSNVCLFISCLFMSALFESATRPLLSPFYQPIYFFPSPPAPTLLSFPPLYPPFVFPVPCLRQYALISLGCFCHTLTPLFSFISFTPSFIPPYSIYSFIYKLAKMVLFFVAV